VSITAKPRAQKLPYPNPENPEHPRYWLITYFRELAEFAELQKLLTQMHRRNARNVTTMAICGAMINAERLTEKAAKYVVSNGHLLFAFPETTVLQGGAA